MLFNWKLFPGTNLQDLNLDWIINFVKMIPSRLPKFSDHHTWLVYDYSTGEYYDSGEPTGGAGEPGEPGKSPIIGANGNWYTWNTETETYTDTGTKAQGVQGEPGAGVASGGVAGDVLIKASGADYNTGWTATPPQMGAIAHINAGNTADKTYNKGDYLVYNGQLYKVIAGTITQDEILTSDVNIQLVTNGGVNDLKSTIPLYEKGQYTIPEIPFFGWVTVGATALDCYTLLPRILPRNAQINIENIGGVIARTSSGTNIPDVPTGGNIDVQLANLGTALRIIIFKSSGYGVTNNIIVNGILQNVVLTIN